MRHHSSIQLLGRPLIPLLALLTACSSPLNDAKEKYKIVKRTGDEEEICKKGKELTEAYLNAKKEDEYNRQKVESAIECQSAELDRQGS